MYRKALEKLIEWKRSSNRKPLILRGARQVGKTWLLKEFGKTKYSNMAYINFEGNKRMEDLFSGDLEISRIISGLQLEAGCKIDPENTVIIFDEVQEVPKALTCLKYFYENAPQYHIIAAGSLLGVAPTRKLLFRWERLLLRIYSPFHLVNSYKLWASKNILTFYINRIGL